MLFNDIVEKIIKTKKDEYRGNTFIINAFFTRVIGINFFFPRQCENKYNVLKNFIFNDTVSQTDKDFILHIFSLAQKHYFSFVKLSKMWKFKRGCSLHNSYDLHFNELDTTKDTLKITLLENGVKYVFKIPELICLINSRLSYSPDFFSEPKQIKNPYTNIAFSKHNLYNIYFKIKESDFLLPVLFHRYFLCNFNLLDFVEQNEVLVREEAIKNFLKTSSQDAKYEHICTMLFDYNVSAENQISIDPDFPMRRLVEVFKPILKYYIINKYSLDSFNKWSNQKKMIKALVEFAIDNSRFGRKIITRHISQIYRLSKVKNSNNIAMGLTTVPSLEMINLEKGHFFIDKVKSERTFYSIFPYSNNNNDIDEVYPFTETHEVYLPEVEEEVEEAEETESNSEGEILEEQSDQTEPLIQPQSPSTSSIEADIQIEDYERAEDSVSSNEGIELLSVDTNNNAILIIYI